MSVLPLRLVASFIAGLALSSVATSQEAPDAESAKPTVPQGWDDALDWRSIGPANMSGRITALAVYETDPSTWWAASAGGGLLKTTNNGVTFEHQFDREATVSVGDVQVSRTDPNIVWVGTGESNPRNSVSWGNGVYKSVDGGATWKHMGLSESFQIGGIAIHPENHDIVYVGALGRLWGPSEERGLFKTTDAGDTWEKVLYVDENTGVIDVNLAPDDPETILAATYERQRDGFDTNDPAKKWGPGSGLWKSTDGGANFTRLTEGLPSVDLGRIDIEYYRADPKIVYAIVESSKIGQEPENAPYIGIKGEAADVGARLTEIIEKGPAAEAGLKVGDIVIELDGETVQSYNDLIAKVRRHLAGDAIQLEVSRDRESVEIDLTLTRHPDSVEDAPEEEPEEPEESDKPEKPEKPEADDADAGEASDKPKEEAGSEKSAPAESTEEARPRGRSPFSASLGGQVENVQDQQGPDGHEFGGVYRSEDGGDTWTRINSVNPRPMYYSQIRVDPSDDNYVYVLGTSLYRSEDGGKKFTSDGAGRGVHVDHHAFWIDPEDGRHAMLGNDGGVYVTYDRLANWDHHNHVAIGQFYHVAVGPRRNYMVYGGLQDNGTWGGPNRVRAGGGARNEDWISIGGGDGFICRVDPNDPDQVYFESQNGGMGRRNLRTGDRGSMRPRAERGTRLRWNWRTPFILSNHNSGIYYTAGNFVFRSWLKGDNLERISPDITNTDRGSATALSESPFTADLLYVGSDDGALWMTKNGGHDWTNLFGEGTPDEAEETEPPAAITVAATAQDATEETAEEADDQETQEDPLRGTWTLETQGGGGAARGGGQGRGAGRAGGGDRPQGRRGRSGGGGGGGGGQPAMTLVLGRNEAGELTGSLDSFRGETPLSKGSFDEETKTLSLRFGDDFETTVTAKLADGALSGTLDFGGRFSREFTAERAKEETAVEEPAGPTIADLVPNPMWVSSIETSGFEEGRVYLSLDGHRSNDDAPHVFASEDYGTSWRSLTANLPETCGSTRVIREDIVNPDVLYLGTEFGAYVSIDRGETWTTMNLPTVAVHEIAQHTTAGEVVAATHGRSLWVLDVTALRQMSKESLTADARLYRPNAAIYWRTEPRTGGTLRRFEGENPSSNAQIMYSLGVDANRASITIKDLAGETIRELEASTTAGLHQVSWDMRRTPAANQGGGRRRGGAARVEPGTYMVELRLDSQALTQPLVVHSDPEFTEAVLWGEEYERQMEIEARLQRGGDEE